jgi:hypothetical protein
MAQLTLLDVPALFTENGFRRRVVDTTTDPVIREWWRRFDRFDLKQQLDIIYPVQTKVQRYVGSMAARAIVGQPCSTIEPAAWLRDGAVVVVNVGKGVVGQDTAALLGGTLLNLVALVVGEQARLPAAARRPVSVLVDEFHVMPGADYETFLSELPKYGASLVLATQSLGRVEALDRAHGRALRSTLFANLDGLFAFHTSAEDARYLVHELGGAVDEQDLVALGEYRCYVRLSTGGARPPVFSVELRAPPETNDKLARILAGRSGTRYGRDPAKLAQAVQAALERIGAARSSAQPAGAGKTEEDAPAGNTGGGRRRSRGRGRATGQSGPAGQQATLFDEADDAAGDADDGDSGDGDGPEEETA